MIKVGIIGSTGYAGAEIVRLIQGHPLAQVVWYGSRSYIDEKYSNIYGNLFKLVDAKCLDDNMEELAKEVIDGKWGNGSDRKSRLTAAGYDYSSVQDKVNELLKGTATKQYNTVKKGDTLSGIAAQHGLNLTKIIQLNPQIKSPNLIYVGDKVRVK